MEDIRPHILVVEDEEQMQEFMRELLDISGYRTTIAARAADACDLIEEIAFDLVITDVRMPGESGIELLKHIKALAPHMGVILLTGLPSLKDAMECMKAGASDYLTKPIEMAALQAAVKKVLATNTEATNDELLHKSLQLEKTIGGYRLLHMIAEGGAGIVYLAQKKGTQDPAVALKVPKIHRCLEQNQRNLHRFFREIRILQKLSHPNIVKVVDYGYDHICRACYLAMEFVEGRPLLFYSTDLIPIELPQKVMFIAQTASALLAAHNLEIFHRDIKPDNIMVVDNKRVKVMDFGIARLPNSELTINSIDLGTPAYMPPESFRGEDYDARSDIFSLGVVAYELFLGCKPFEGETHRECMDAILLGNPPDPCSIKPEFPPPLKAILGAMLAKDRAQRYKTMHDVMVDLKAYWQNAKEPLIAPTRDHNAVWAH